MKHSHLLNVALLLAISLATPIFAASPVPQPPCPVDNELANLLAGADIVLIGKMDVPKQRARAPPVQTCSSSCS